MITGVSYYFVSIQVCLNQFEVRFVCSISFLWFVTTKGPENWKVYKVWWGNKKPMFGDLTNVPGVNISSYIHPKKLFVSSLTKIYSEPEVELRRAELERAFRKYGGAQGCIVKVPTNSTFAFVEVETSRMADAALREMASTYTMSRARRTKQEMLQEQREASGKDKDKEDKREWD